MLCTLQRSGIVRLGLEPHQEQMEGAGFRALSTVQYEYEYSTHLIRY